MVSAAEREQKGKGENSNYIHVHVHVPAQHVHVQPYIVCQGNIQEDRAYKLPWNRQDCQVSRTVLYSTLYMHTCT